jgi:hypothetical protein
LGRARVTGGKFPYILIHQLEGNLIAPLIQRQLIFIPPAVMLLVIVTVLFRVRRVRGDFRRPDCRDHFCCCQ